MTESAGPLRVMEETPAYWRIIFDYPPFNVADGTMFQALQDLLARINVDPSLRVVVFESANHDFYLSHFDLTGKLGNVMTVVGPSGLLSSRIRLSVSPDLQWLASRRFAAVFEARAASLCSLATCGLRRAKTRAWDNPKLESDCIPGAVERNVSHIWWVVVARWKSFSGPMTLMAIPRSVMGT